MPVTYTPPDGATIDLDDGVTTRFLGLDGRGAPPVAPIETVVPTGPGAALHRVTVGVRQVRLSMRILAADFANLDDQLVDLASGMAASSGGDAREGVLELTSFAGVVRRLRCLPVGGLEWSGERRGVSLPAALTFRAVHPWWYGGAEQSQQIVPLQPGDAGFPWTFPVSFGRNAPSGEATIGYTGTAWTRSLHWSVPGPVRAPALSNVTTGVGLAFASDLVIPSGLSLEVRMGWRPDDPQVELRAWVEDAAGGRTSALGDLTATVRPLTLAPGDNLLVATQAEDRTPATVHTVRYWREYVAA